MSDLGRLLNRVFRLPSARPVPALSRAEVHRYWESPPDAVNAPEKYTEVGDESSAFLTSLARKYADPGAPVLEIGCNAGRNLDHLYRAGFRNLAAVEISQPAIDLFRRTYPDAAAATAIHVGPAEDLLPEFGTGTFDFVFTMEVLALIHDDSEPVFAEIARVTRQVLVTIEDERDSSLRHFPRNYQRVFERLGMRQVESTTDLPDLGDTFVARVFRAPSGIR